MAISVEMDTLHCRIVSTREGKITGEEKLREKIAFIYGSIMSYPGRPTDSQLQGLDLLTRESEKIQNEVSSIISNQIPVLNKEVVKEKKEEIKIVSEEAFLKEP